MDEQQYPGYVDLLKLKKEHPIYTIAALTLGIDPRYLKLMPNYDELRKGFNYDEDFGPTHKWYYPLKADQLEIDQYLKSESKSGHLVPLYKLPDDLGAYKPAPLDILYDELKSSLIEAAKNKDIICPKPEIIDERDWLGRIKEHSKVTTESVKNWFHQHNFRTPFFETPPKPKNLPDYLDKNNPEKPEELIIAIEAWQRFSGLEISHPKAYIEKWLDETFASDKKLAEQSVGTYVSKDAKERIAMTANWRKKGGPKSDGLKQDIYDKAIAKDLSK